MQSTALHNEVTQLRSQVESSRAENQRFKLGVETLECKLRAAVDGKMQAEEESAAIVETLNGAVCVCVCVCVWVCWCVYLHAYIDTDGYISTHTRHACKLVTCASTVVTVCHCCGVVSECRMLVLCSDCMIRVMNG